MNSQLNQVQPITGILHRSYVQTLSDLDRGTVIHTINTVGKPPREAILIVIDNVELFQANLDPEKGSEMLPKLGTVLATGVGAEEVGLTAIPINSILNKEMRETWTREARDLRRIERRTRRERF